MIRMIRKHPILFVLFLLIVAFIVGGVIYARRPKPVFVRFETSERKDKLEAIVRASGDIQAHEMVDIQTEVAGLIVELPVEEGQTVKKNDILLRIDPFQTETDLAAARANHAASDAEVKRAAAALAGAEASLESDKEQLKVIEASKEEALITVIRDRKALKRQQELLDKGATSQDEFEVVEARARISERRVESSDANIRKAKSQITVSELGVEQQRSLKKAAEERLLAAEASLNRATDQMKKVTLLSPLNGVIVSLNVEEGERAVPGIQSSPQATLMTIADMSVIEAKIEVDETDIVRVALGQKAKIEVDAMPDKPLDGRVTEIGSAPIASAGQEGKDFEVVIAIENPPQPLRVGMSCEAEITVDTRQNVLTVPIQSLVTRELPVDAEGRYKPSPKPQKGQKPPTAKPGDAIKKEEMKELNGVYLFGEDGMAHFREVESGIMGETSVEIIKGLDEKDKIITGPLKSLRGLNEWTLIKEEPKPGMR